MALWQGRSKKKNTGGRYRHFRSKRKFEIAPETQFTVIREESNMKIYRTRGNNSKGRLMTASYANVFNPKTGKSQRTRILTETENEPAGWNQPEFAGKWKTCEKYSLGARVNTPKLATGIYSRIQR